MFVLLDIFKVHDSTLETVLSKTPATASIAGLVLIQNDLCDIHPLVIKRKKRDEERCEDTHTHHIFLSCDLSHVLPIPPSVMVLE